MNAANNKSPAKQLQYILKIHGCRVSVFLTHRSTPVHSLDKLHFSPQKDLGLQWKCRLYSTVQQWWRSQGVREIKSKTRSKPRRWLDRVWSVCSWGRKWRLSTPSHLWGKLLNPNGVTWSLIFSLSGPALLCCGPDKKTWYNDAECSQFIKQIQTSFYHISTLKNMWWSQVCYLARLYRGTHIKVSHSW